MTAPGNAGTAGRRVAIVGAGVSGLVTARVLLDDGFDVSVFEKAAEIGGVWASSRTYPGLRANNTRVTYAYSDFAFPSEADEFPTAGQIRAYLRAYARKHELDACISLGAEVVGVSRHDAAADGGPFDVRIGHAEHAGRSDEAIFDFVVICSGVFSRPSIPDFPGAHDWPGRILHSSEFLDARLAAGRDVVVIGAGKSAVDCAAAASRVSRSCHMVFRAPHRMLPRYVGRGVPSDRLMMMRLTEMLLPPYVGARRATSLLHRLGAPALRAWWRAQTRLMDRLLDVPQLRADRPLPAGLENVGVGCEAREGLRDGRIRAIRGAVARLTPDGRAVLHSGEELPAQLVICATGWRQELSFLEPALRDRVTPGGKFHLYRHILPADVAGLGFIGFASSVACPLTSEIAAHWLSQIFRGELELPPSREMRARIALEHDWAARAFPARAQGYFIGPYLAHYFDDLLDDMGLRRWRTGNVLAEYLTPLTPGRYRDVATERRVRRGGPSPA